MASYGRSILPVLAGWVAWVYMLSLLVLFVGFGFRGPGPTAMPRPEIKFVDNGQDLIRPSVAFQDAITNVEIELSEPLDRDIEVPISVNVTSVSTGQADRPACTATASIKAGEKRGKKGP